MEIELTQRTIDAIAYRTAVIVMQKLKKAQKESQNLPKMVSTREAAAILGITSERMRQIAERFPHIKQGEHKQGKLLFVRDALLENY
ncbi:MAG: hypothetical protein ACI4UC_05195 [Alloprevotella sp.]